jgi:hypothetical protein
VGQADLDLLPADHDRPAGGDPPGDDQGLGQAGRLDGPGPGSAQPGPGFGRDRAGHGAGQDAASQDVDDRAVEPAVTVTGYPPVYCLPGYPEPLGTSVTGMPSRTSRMAWYLCSTTFNSRSIARVSRIK